MLLSENARARGFRLDGYGVFFDVDVPSFGTRTRRCWSLRTLDQNDLGLESALKALQAHVEAAGDPNLQQALQARRAAGRRRRRPRCAAIAGVSTGARTRHRLGRRGPAASDERRAAGCRS